MCGIRFDLEEEQLAFVREYASESERELQQEEIDERTQEDIIEISDNEEGPSQYNSKRRRSIEPVEELVDEPEDEPEEEPTHEGEPDGPSQYNSKRRRSIEPVEELVDEPEDEPEEEPTHEGEPDLPEQNTQRVSGRVRKRSRLLDGYEI
jgi:hypothetical protein